MAITGSFREVPLLIASDPLAESITWKVDRVILR